MPGRPTEPPARLLAHCNMHFVYSLFSQSYSQLMYGGISQHETQLWIIIVTINTKCDSTTVIWKWNLKYWYGMSYFALLFLLLINYIRSIKCYNLIQMVSLESRLWTPDDLWRDQIKFGVLFMNSWIWHIGQFLFEIRRITRWKRQQFCCEIMMIADTQHIECAYF